MLGRSRRISTRLIVAVSVAVASTTLVSTAIQWVQRQAAVTESLRQHAAEVDATIDVALRDAMAKADSEVIAGMIGRLGKMPAVKRVYLIDPAGKVAHGSDPAMPGEVAGWRDFQRVAKSKSNLQEVRNEKGRPFLMSLSPVAADESCLSCHTDLKVGDVTGYLGYERWADSEFGDLRRSQAAGVFTGVLTIAVIGVVLSIIVRRTTRPLMAMASAAKQIAEGDLEQSIAYKSEDEIGALADAFRSMVGYLRDIGAAAAALSHGDLSRTITPRSSKDVVAQNFILANQAIHGVLTESSKLTEAAARGELSRRGDPKQFPGAYAAIVEGLNRTLDAVVGPLSVAAAYLERLAKGDIPPKIAEAYAGDFNAIKDNLNACIDAVASLIADVQHLAAAAVAGRLDVRADASKHRGDFARIVCGFNDTLDAVIVPLGAAAECLDKIAQGEIPTRIQVDYPGDFDTIKGNLNTVIDAIGAMVTDVRHLAAAAVAGRLDVRADTSKHRGDYGRIVRGFNDTLDAVIVPLRVAADSLDRIAKGDIPDTITANFTGDFRAIQENLNTCMVAIRALISDSAMLADAAVAGRLDVRADASRHRGDYGRIVRGFNATLDAVTVPLGAAAECLDKIAKGEIPARIEVDYRGDFNTIKDNLNTVIAAISTMVTDVRHLAAAAVAGQLNVRADTSQHRGDYGRIVRGFNDTLDAVIVPLRVAAESLDRIAKGDIPAPITGDFTGDFRAIQENLNTCMVAIRALISDSAMLADAAVAGRLDVRADASKHRGDFGRIVRGFNDTLNAVIVPLRISADSLDRIAKGDIPDPITAEFAGEFGAIRQNLNTCIAAIRALISDSTMLAEAAVAGRLGTRADASKHRGDFAQVMAGINRTLDSLLQPVHEAAGVLQKVAKRDLRVRTKNKYQGDHAVMSSALDVAISNLDQGLGTVSVAADQFAQASAQISEQSQELAGGSSRQASVLSDIAGSLHNLSVGAERNAEHAKRARTVAEKTTGGAAEGLASMDRLSEAIARIREASMATGKIVKVIDEIAFQTNLLALNAAVEAARAGDSGRGFAVVAEEVRSLAKRSAQSARSTSELIAEAVKSAESGFQMNREVKQMLQVMHTDAQRVSAVMAEIVEASAQQSRDISSVDTRVEDMKEMTQSVAASAQESAAVAQELASQAQEAQAVVAGFQLSAPQSGDLDGHAFSPEALPVSRRNSLEGRRPL